MATITSTTAERAGGGFTRCGNGVRGVGMGVPGYPRLANDGAPLIPTAPDVQPHPPPVRQGRAPGQFEDRDSFVKPPEHDFPRFDGQLPNLWLDHCSSYFELYKTPVHNWGTTASLYLDGRATLWWQTVRQGRRPANWEAFGRTLQEEFGPDEFEDMMHQLHFDYQLQWAIK
ncbi:hypothetical protein QYE76_042039 [Lolium multiflorum]|uniref:Retrotransposon gag domain-containing protein n=1 Tax=Lolium multiflorum TaxID=4521 RepID=A0AAD8TGH4_LOLMU|nr:hypothetical protein QYE76_042039 [Lolium multiflorum]